MFRDQSFSADMRGHAVQRIKDVKSLRARQFAEDQGPLAHPVRPSSYLKIDNFYTATIYEKGAEVIRMLKTLIGPEAFRSGMDLYFDRWDGHATTVEEFIRCFAEASGQDLTDFFSWYEQAGTPQVTLASRYDEAARSLELELTQETAPTPGQPAKRALPIPVIVGLLDPDGRTQAFERGGQAMDETVIVLDGARASVTLTGIDAMPVVSGPTRLLGAGEEITDHTPRPRTAMSCWPATPTPLQPLGGETELARALILGRATGHRRRGGRGALRRGRWARAQRPGRRPGLQGAVAGASVGAGPVAGH